MKKLFFSILVVAVGLFAIDRLGGMTMQWVSRNSNDVFSPKFRYLLNDIYEDVVLMGASRCHHHYVPSIISDSLNRKVYNAGIGGANNIYSQYIVLNHILERYTPKVICLEVMPTDYNVQQDPFSVISFFAPLIGNSVKADSVFRMAGTYWRYKASHLYRYNAKASSNLWGLVLNRQKGNDNGYILLPEPHQYPGKLVKEETDYEKDPLKMEYLKRFVGLCRQNGIKLVFVVSPKYTMVEESHYKVLRDFANEHFIPFMDYHTTGFYHDHPELFKDAVHLWDKGARYYSSVFAHDLKQVLIE